MLLQFLVISFLAVLTILITTRSIWLVFKLKILKKETLSVMGKVLKVYNHSDESIETTYFEYEYNIDGIQYIKRRKNIWGDLRSNFTENESDFLSKFKVGDAVTITVFKDKKNQSWVFEEFYLSKVLGIVIVNILMTYIYYYIVVDMVTI